MPAQGRGGAVLKPIHWFWLAVIASLFADLASKEVVFQALGGGPPIDNIYTDDHMIWVLPNALRLICHYNTGGAFGLASGKLLLFLVATAILVPSLVLTAYHTKEPDAPIWALGLIVGGAVGNLYDRIFFIGVRDFLDFLNPATGKSIWPVFNVADIAIVLGVVVYFIWSVIDTLRKRRQQRGNTASRSEDKAGAAAE